MREILFRGKTLDDGEWIYGYFVQQYGSNEIYLPESDEAGFERHHIDPKTVGQYTGLTDINGKRIYEGDIVTLNLCKKDISIVMFGEYKDCNTEYDDVYLGFYIKFDDLAVKRYCETDGNIMFPLVNLNKKYEIIGNIYDNPELLAEQLKNLKINS